MPDIKRISFRVAEDLHKALKFMAIEDSTSMQELIVKAVEEKYEDRIKKF